MKNIYLFIVAILLLSAPALAQTRSAESYSLKGAFIDSVSNTPIQFATVTVSTKANPDKQLRVVATDDKGSFRTTVPAKGDYLVTVFSMGKALTTLPVNIQRAIDLGSVMVFDTGNELTEAVVAAQKPLVKVDLDKLTYDTESDPESKTDNALEMLRKVPMVTVDAEDNIQVKGSSNFKVYVNGKPSTMITNNPSEVLRSLPASSIKNVEVITDPGAKYDAEGVGGILNIVMATRTDDGYNANIGANVNTLGGYGGNVYLALKYGKFGFSGSYGYSYWTRPSSDTYTTLSNYQTGSVLTESGTMKQRGPHQFGSGELSYEIDSLNLITLSVDHHYGKAKINQERYSEMTGGITSPYAYDLLSTWQTDHGSTSINANYQRSFKERGKLLTASYRYDYSPNNSSTETHTNPIYGYSEAWERSDNDAASNTHTVQLDFVKPFKNGHNVEVGAKYILRYNTSDAFFEEYDYVTNAWVNNVSRENDMDYRQGVTSGYGSYSYRKNKLGLNVGLRVENTDTNIDFTTVKDVHSNTTDVVPTFAVSYQLGMTKTLRFNYNMRIRRPGISYLNPFEDRSIPQNISFGNPNLKSEKSNNVSLSYSTFSQKVNLSAELRYSIIDNAIQDVSYMQDSLLYNTYDNIGRQQEVGLNLYASWSPIKDLRLSVNGGFGYVDVRANDANNTSNSGFGGRTFANATYSFLGSFRVGLFGGFFKRPPTLQSDMGPFVFSGISLGKDFFDKRLSLTVSVQDPFYKSQKVVNKTTTPIFYRESDMHISQQSVGFRVSFKFGNLKSQLKKVQRGITNDDLMQGESGTGGGVPSME